MRIECAQCRQAIEFEDTAPKFCSECGSSLSDSMGTPNTSSPTTRDGETITRVPTAMSVGRAADDLAEQETRAGNAFVGGQDTVAADAEHPEAIGPYRLVRKLGQGGMGTVYEAEHRDSQRRVALKLLSPDVRGTEEMVQRFRRESQIAASINHPRSTFVYEAGEHNGQLFITMELMGGGTLKDVVAQEGPLPVGRAVDYVLDIIDGLLVAHNAGIVHRDLKPSNSFVDADGRIKVGDFGLAKSFVGDSTLTQTGTFMGTPQFAAPEQIRNSEVDERTDIYALGGTLFYLLTGRAPFVGNPAQVISSIASDAAPKVSDFVKDIPRPLVRLIGQTLEKDPDRRPFNLNMLRDGLLPYSTRGAMTADPGRRVAAFFLDSLLSGFVFSLLAVSFLSPLLMLLLGMLKIGLPQQAIGMIIIFPLVLLYYAICESRWGRTVGKWLFGMRVVNQQGTTPSFPQALLRAALIPGATMAVSQIANFFFIDADNVRNLNDVITLIFYSQAIGLIGWIPLGLLLCTARRENGYRGVHGLVSGTRVVRLSGDLESKLLDDFPVTVPARSYTCQSLGGFEVMGTYRENNGQKTLLGKDCELDRPVWLFVGFSDNPVSDRRRHLTRPSRLRIIGQSQTDDMWWYATDSVAGLPFADVLNDPLCDWRSVIPLIRDVAYELALSLDNGLVPEGMSVDHVWLEHTGQIRILDHCLVPAVNADSRGGSPAQTTEGPHAAAVSTLQQLVDQFLNRHQHPVVAEEFARELANRKNDGDVLEWSVTRLNELIELPSTWNSLDRTGLLAISCGLELPLLTAAVFVTSFFLMMTGLSTTAQATLAAVAGLGTAAAFGFFFNGGPAMHLSSVSLRRNATKEVASRFRSVFRSLLAWLPWIALLTAFVVLIFHQSKTDPEVLHVTPDHSPVFGYILLFSLLPFGLIMLGVMVALLYPPRGLPDFLAGTRLMRK